MQARTPVVVFSTWGNLARTVEWYDRDCIKLTRVGSPNLLFISNSSFTFIKLEKRLL